MADLDTPPARPRPIKFELPLAIMGHGDATKALKQKLFLIQKFGFADTKLLIELLRNKANLKKPLEADNKKHLELLWKSVELDDLDLTELFVCLLPTFVDKASRAFLEKMDPMPWFHQDRCGDIYDDFMKEAGKMAAKEVARFALPRVRAKLALQEIICAITSDPKYFSKLIAKTPRYLACPSTADLLCKLKLGATGFKNVKALEGFNLITESIRFNKKMSLRKYGYWHIDFYFNEVLACLKTLNSIREKDKHSAYANDIAVYWGIPQNYKGILKGHIKNPTELTLDIMIEKKMIDEASSYRNVIMPYVKKIKAKYPSLRACNPIVERLLDLPTKAPDLLSRLDLYKQLESFEFDLTERELKVGHAISYPTYAIGV